MPDTSIDKLRTVGALVIQRRLARGFKTKIQFSDATGLSTRVLTDLEAGKRRLGSVSYVQIETALGWPAGEIDSYLDGVGSFLDDEEQRPGEQSVSPSGNDDDFGTIKARKPANMTDEDFKRLLAEYREEIEWKLDRAARER